MEGVKSRRAEYAEQTRAALLAAAVEAFAEHGYAATSISEIAATARVTKGAVYHHFSDKQGLLDAVMREQNEAAQARILAAVATHPHDAWDAAMAAIDAALEICCDPIAGRLIYLEGPDGLGWRRWREYERAYTRHDVDMLLRAAVAADIYPADLPVEAMTHVITGMITYAGVALAGAPKENRTRVRREIREALIRTLQGLRCDR